MLVQLNRINGVEASSTNTAGTLVHIDLAEGADSAAIVTQLESLFKEQGRTAFRLLGDDLATALRDEDWREANQVHELSEIEFRTVFLRRVKQFAETATLPPSTADQLVKWSNEVIAETPKSNANTDWTGFCSSLEKALLKRAAQVLSQEQSRELERALQANVGG